MIEKLSLAAEFSNQIGVAEKILTRLVCCIQSEKDVIDLQNRARDYFVAHYGKYGINIPQVKEYGAFD
jgi:hypothetical protein